MGEMRIMDAVKGDLKVVWDKNKPDEIKAAQDQFKSLTKKGYIAFKVKKGGDAGKQIRKFDEKAEKIILSPALQGG